MPYRVHSVLAVCLVLSCGVHVCTAQVTNLTSTQAAPIESRGHDYIHLLSETVDPAIGSVNLHIDLPTPKSRGFSIPFGINYSSNGIYQPNPGLAGANLASFPDTFVTPGNGPGWRYALPKLTYSGTEYLEQLINGDGTLGPLDACDVTYGYNFQDAGGAQHTIPITVVSQYASQGQIDCSIGLHNTLTILTGSDGYYAGTTTDGNGGNLCVLCGNLPVMITGSDGIIYKFTGSSDGPPTGDPNHYNFIYYPSTIEDRNGNVANVGGSVSAGLNITDSAGRSAVSVSSYNNATKKHTISLTGISTPIQVQWQQISTSSHTGWVFTDPPPPPSYVCGGTGQGPLVGFLTVISSITLPNQRTFQFEYNNPYGLLSKIIYPSGGYVSYDWGENPLSEYYVGDGLGQDSNHSPVYRACHYRYGVPTIFHRYVSYDGTTIAEQQDFSYAPTQWGCTTACGWTSKQTIVTTRDCIRAASCSSAPSFETIYNYLPIVIPDPPNSAPSYLAGSQAAVESSIVYKDFSGTILRTVSKGWVDQYTLTCPQFSFT